LLGFTKTCCKISIGIEYFISSTAFFIAIIL
jgi:hypothetical protein